MQVPVWQVVWDGFLPLKRGEKMLFSDRSNKQAQEKFSALSKRSLQQSFFLLNVNPVPQQTVNFLWEQT